ncbi:FliO/MopB family protein [Thalassospira marina]|uniref:Flagellar assembly protein FliO n=1 Tax=Thalassospira marina TaxID=2048283 RepID=A0A2N3KZF3_9PROT|nr:flagellar biosynthetic protein FliO [Thalassospira marina]PKR55949.1 flagellar assembly protein FliO [Thalassospira marina]
MDMGSYFRFIAALVFVLALIGVIALLARRFVPGARTVNRGKKRRLALIEVLPLDAKRRLVLVRRDDTEHLIVLSPNGDVVVERNIGTTFEQLLGDEDATETRKDVPQTTTDSENRTARNDRNVMP